MVAFDGAQTLDLTGPSEVFAAAGRVLGEPVYRVEVLTSDGAPIRTSSGMEVRTRALARTSLRASDTVLVVGGEEGPIRAAIADRALLAYLARASRVARRVGSVCTGAFVLAASGVLDGLRVATHWESCDRLASFRPTLEVDRDAIFVREGRIWTSAGVTTGIDMALAMVEEDHDRRLADAIAARLVLYVRRPGFQSQFTDALVAQASSSDPLGPAVAWARANLRTVDVPRLAKRAGLSERTLHRRCHALFHTTPAKLIERLRVEHARTLVAKGASQKELAARCGFGTAERMRHAFGRVLGMGPRDYALLFAA